MEVNHDKAPNRSVRLQTVYNLLEGYHTLKVENILAPLADSCTQQVLPASLGLPTRSKADYGKHATGICTIFKDFHMEPQAVFEDEGQNSVVVYAKMIGELANDMGPWENECILMLRMSEDGTQIVEHKEFVDSKKFVDAAAKSKGMKEKMGTQ